MNVAPPAQNAVKASPFAAVKIWSPIVSPVITLLVCGEIIVKCPSRVSSPSPPATISTTGNPLSSAESVNPDHVPLNGTSFAARAGAAASAVQVIRQASARRFSIAGPPKDADRTAAIARAQRDSAAGTGTLQAAAD